VKPESNGTESLIHPSLLAEAAPAATGFPRNVPPAAGAARQPTPLPRRPKGRWFVGLLLVVFCGVLGKQVWNAFFRYQAYGTVSGRILQLTPQWDGVVRSIHVREGEEVRQGQVLVSMENLEQKHRLAQLGDDLHIAQATLDGEVAKLKWQAALNLDQGKGAQALYYEAHGELLREQARLELLNASMRRAGQSLANHAYSPEEFDQIRYSRQGQEQKVAQLKKSVQELRQRMEQAQTLRPAKDGSGDSIAEYGGDHLKPFLARIQALHAERERVREQTEQGEIRAPVNGVVLKVAHFAGERCKAGDLLVKLLEQSSLEIILYVPQQAGDQFPDGTAVDLQVEPMSRPLSGTVVRCGQTLEPAPEHLKRHYSEGQRLLPVYVRPGEEAERWLSLRVGATARLPYSWTTWSRKLWK
jgi:multidrug resistance efflux pump